MSAHQMVCHLSDGYRMLTDRRVSRSSAFPAASRRDQAARARICRSTGAPIADDAGLDRAGAGTQARRLRAGRRRTAPPARRRSRPTRSATPTGRCTRCSAGCRRRPGCAGPIFTPIITCGSLALQPAKGWITGRLIGAIHPGSASPLRTLQLVGYNRAADVCRGAVAGPLRPGRSRNTCPVSRPLAGRLPGRCSAR